MRGVGVWLLDGFLGLRMWAFGVELFVGVRLFVQGAELSLGGLHKFFGGHLCISWHRRLFRHCDVWKYCSGNCAFTIYASAVFRGQKALLDLFEIAGHEHDQLSHRRVFFFFNHYCPWTSFAWILFLPTSVQ